VKTRKDRRTKTSMEKPEKNKLWYQREKNNKLLYGKGHRKKGRRVLPVGKKGESRKDSDSKS